MSRDTTATARVARARAREGVGGATRDFEDRVVLGINLDRQSLAESLALGFEVVERAALDGLDMTVTRLRVPPDTDTEVALRLLNRRAPDSGYALNHTYSVAAEDCRDQVLHCYPRAAIRWTSDDELCGEGLRVGLIDTAVNPGLPALSGRVASTRFFADGERRTRGDHGTGVATVLVGSSGSVFPGLLPRASLYAADVFHVDDHGRVRAYAINVARGLDWLVSQRVPVINMSMMGPPNLVLEQAVGRAAGKGALIVAAAGNGGRDALPAYPAAYEGVVAVTAVDRLLQPYPRANHGYYLDFAAPGVSIWSSSHDGSGRYWHGTSFAAAYVTAIIANDTGATSRTGGPISPLYRIRETAIDLGEAGHDRVFGWGLAQAASGCGELVTTDVSKR